MTLSDIVRAAFEAAFPGEDFSAIRVVPATDAKFGDYQCNDALKIAKKVGMKPRDAALRVAEILQTSQSADATSASLPQTFSKVEVAGPGFLNLTVSGEWLAEQLKALAADKHLGIVQSGAGKRVVIDYSSPNAAKQMHIGHIRSTVIGNAIDRIFRSLGYEVIADNHLGDWGTQFGILIKGYRECLSDEERENLTVANLEKCYVLSAAKAKDEDGVWKEDCRRELVKLQQGDKENLALWKRFIDISIGEFERMYSKLGVKFDTYRGESFYNSMMPGVVERLVADGLAVESEGALVVNLESEGLGVAIVRKSDGGYNYTTSDLACVASRVADYSPERIIYVTDDRQQLHFKQFFSICAKMGITVKLVHVPFGLMSYQGKAISTREGNLIKLDDLLSEAVRRSLDIVKDRGGDERLAAQIGIGAVKYADLSHDPATAIDFTWEKALALEGNSGPYLQYAYARVCSLLDKADAGRGTLVVPSSLPDAGRGTLVVPSSLPDATSASLPDATSASLPDATSASLPDATSASLPDATSASLPDATSASLPQTGARQACHSQTSHEKKLALQLLEFPGAVSRAAEAYKPSILADYLYQTAQLYSSFYQNTPVLKSEEPLRSARLALCSLFGEILSKGLGLLGIETPKRI